MQQSINNANNASNIIFKSYPNGSSQKSLCSEIVVMSGEIVVDGVGTLPSWSIGFGVGFLVSLVLLS